MDENRPSTAPAGTPSTAPGTPPAGAPARWEPQPHADWQTQMEAPTAPVVEPARPRARSLRWAVAAVVTAIVVVSGGALAFFAATGQTGPAFGPEYLPQDTVSFVEVRLDLPADQRENAVQLFSRFPGWADGAAFDTKIHQALDDQVSRLSGGRLVPSRDIAPWFDGRVFLSISELPTMESSPAAMLGGYLAGLGVKDRAALQATIDRFRTETPGVTVSEEAHGGATIVTADLGEHDLGSFSWAVTDTVLLVAFDATRIRESLDALAGTTPSLADAEAYKRIWARVPAGRLTASYSNIALLRPLLAAQMEAARDQIEGLGSMMDLGPGMDTMLDGVTTFSDMLPDQMVQVLTVAGDGITAEMFGTPGPRTPTLSVRDSGLAKRMPAETMVYAEARDIGVTIHNATDWILSVAGDAVPVEQLDQVEAFLGVPLEDYFDFVQDVAVGGWFDGEKLHVGMAATVTDETAASQRVNALLAALRLAAATGGAPLTVTETDVGGVAVTHISSTGPVMPEAPIDPSVSIAVGNGLLLIGTGDFADAALQRDEAGSLAADPGFKAASSSAGSPNAGMLYVDIADIRTIIEAEAPDDAMYETELKPYLEPLDSFIFVVNSSSELLSMRMQVSVQ